MIRRSVLPTLALLALLAGVAQASTLTGTVDVVGAAGDADAVVYVDGDAAAPATGTAAMDQQGMTFLPHVLAVQVGTTVEFLNSDQVSHNVFTPDGCADRFNLGTWGMGDKRTHTFDKPCAAVMLCAIHPEMEAWVVAVPTPHFAVTAEDGSFAIEGVPDGPLTLKVWHPKVKKESSHRVEVDGDTEVHLEVGG